MRRIGSITIVAMLGLASASGAAVAQTSIPDGPGFRIPVDSPGFELRLSPVGATAAVFQEAGLVDGEVDAALLPIRLVDLATGDVTVTLDGPTDYAVDVAFSPDGTRLAALHWNGELVIWDLAGPTPEAVLRTPSVAMGGGHVAFLPDGETLLVEVGYSPQRFFLTNVRSGAIEHIMGLSAHTWREFRDQYLDGPPFDTSYAAFAVSPDGSTLVTANLSDEVASWDIPSGQPVTLRPASEEPGRMNIRQLAFTPDGGSLVYFDRSDHGTHVLDPVSGAEQRTLPRGGPSFAVAPDGSAVAWMEQGLTSDLTDVFLASLTGRSEPQGLASIRMRLMAPSSIAFTPDGSRLVIGGLFARSAENAIVVLPVD